MKGPVRPTFAEALKVGLLELIVVLAGLIFVRKEVYLAGNFRAMILHWQEYALLALMLIDGICRGFGELQGQAAYSSPFRKRYLKYLLPATLFLFVSTSSLCDKLNAAAIHEEWFRDLGLAILASGVYLCAWSQNTKPVELEAEIELSVEEKSGLEPVDEESPEKESNVPDVGRAEESKKTSDEKSVKKPLGESEKKDDEAKQTHDDESEITSDQMRSEKSDDESSVDPDETSAEITTQGPWNKLRYPGRTAVLLELIGISMTLSACLPLLTLPGLFVVFKWELADVEAFRISQFGQKYLNYRKRSWFLIPYIY